MFEIMEVPSQEAVIKVIGVGGCGGNAVDHMIDKGVKGVEFIAANTDAQALRRNQATVQLQLGSDITNDGSWVSLRQNLPPIVENGASSISRYPGTYWGDNFHQVQDDFRSAICTRADGRLMYVAMGMVRIETLARTLPALGCVLGMELDINGNWPQFVSYQGTTNEKSADLLDKRMSNPRRYLRKSDKDFIALFDPALLPAGVVK